MKKLLLLIVFIVSCYPEIQECIDCPEPQPEEVIEQEFPAGSSGHASNTEKQDLPECGYEDSCYYKQPTKKDLVRPEDKLKAFKPLR